MGNAAHKKRTQEYTKLAHTPDFERTFSNIPFSHTDGRKLYEYYCRMDVDSNNGVSLMEFEKYFSK